MDERTAGNLELVGGAVCLDFANTVSTRAEGTLHSAGDFPGRRLHREYLTTYNQLVVWSQHTGLLTEQEAKTLQQSAARHPALAAAALDRAIVLRETIYRIFVAVAEGRGPDSADLAAMNAALHESLSHLHVLPSAGSAVGFQWAWDQGGASPAGCPPDGGDLDRMLWPIVRSAADLLISADLRRVRQCAGEGCDWLFVDSSKNHSRHWCSMNTCGSRAKARRYYQRRKTQKDAGK